MRGERGNCKGERRDLEREKRAKNMNAITIFMKETSGKEPSNAAVVYSNQPSCSLECATAQLHSRP